MGPPNYGLRYASIHKDAASLAVRPNLADYDAARAQFRWEAARGKLTGLPQGGGLNIAFEAVDRHAGGEGKDKIAIRWIGKTGERRNYSYGDLAQSTNGFANALRSLGAGPGDAVFVLLGRIPELYIATLGALKAKSVVSPLFSAFGPEPIATRMEIGAARVLVTTQALYRRKIEALRPRLPKLEHVILVDAEPGEIGEALPDALKIANPVIIRILERARVDMVDDRRFPPDHRHLRPS
jgi:acetyl-CoA synthetase